LASPSPPGEAGAPAHVSRLPGRGGFLVARSQYLSDCRAACCAFAGVDAVELGRGPWGRCLLCAHAMSGRCLTCARSPRGAGVVGPVLAEDDADPPVDGAAVPAEVGGVPTLLNGLIRGKAGEAEEISDRAADPVDRVLERSEVDHRLGEVGRQSPGVAGRV